MIRLHLGLVGIHDLEVAHLQEACGNNLFRALFRRGGGHEVAGELLFDELVERLVPIEGLDEVIAIAPSVFREDFVGGADHVGVAGEIEPVAGPALAVGRRSEQAVDDFGVGVVGLIVREGDDFLGGGGEAGEVEADPSDPGVSVGVASGLEALGFDFREEEAVEWIFWPDGVFDGGSGRISHRLEGPELSSVIEIDGALWLGGLGGFAVTRVWCAALHPFFEDGDFVRR